MIYEDGEEVDRVQINSSSYQPSQRILRVGTKKKETKKEEKNKKSKKKKTKNNNADASTGAEETTN